MVGDKIKALRIDKKMSQATLGSLLGLTQQAVGKWESNKAEPDTEALKKLSEIFSVPVDSLIENPNNDEDNSEELIILNRAAKKMSPENKKKLLDMAKVMFKEEFND